MKKKLTLLLYILFTQSFFAQQLEELVLETTSGWYTFKSDVNLSTDQFLNMAVEVLNLGPNNQFSISKVQTDELGFTHTRLTQNYKDIPVEVGDFILHEQNSRLKSMNGKLALNLNLSVQPSLNAEHVLQKAMDFIGADEYMWENEANDHSLKELLEDSSATYYPQPQLIIAKDFNDKHSDYRLCYKMDIYASKPVSKKKVYIDANTAKVIFVEEKLHTGDVPGLAHTKYSGVRNIIADYMPASGLYRLRESTGGGIHTYNGINGLTTNPPKDFVDSTNIWNNINVSQDEIATDVHWGAEQAYSYFLNEHNRYSYNNSNARIISFVHGGNYDNAFWDGQFMVFGDGNVNDPFTSIDIVGHEFTHALIEHSAKLIYAGEHGALNESFCDIFGTLIERHGDSAHFNYLLAEKVFANGLGVRSLADPNSYWHPDTYKEKYWYSPIYAGDIHVQSGVQNYWFYVLAEGDLGINDLGNSYNVQGIGADKAAKIAYRSLVYYLSKFSVYQDAREGSIAAAQDLYGSCSNEVLTTSEAWYTVGLGQAFSNQDMLVTEISYPSSSCDLTQMEYVSGEMIYYDCFDTLTPGDSIRMGYQLDNQSPVYQQISVTQNLTFGSPLMFFFNQTVDLSSNKSYQLKVWVDYPNDNFRKNDTLVKSIKTGAQYDFSAKSIWGIGGACSVRPDQKVTIISHLDGCSFILNGIDTLSYGYKIDNQPSVVQYLPPGSYVAGNKEDKFFFNIIEDFSAKKEYDITFWVNYPLDDNPLNDTSHWKIQNPETINEHFFSFENKKTSVDSIFFHRSYKTNIDIVNSAAAKGNLGLRFSGDDASQNLDTVYHHLYQYDSFDPWYIFKDHSSIACACVDARDWDSVKVEFDLKQTYSRLWGEKYDYQGNKTSSFRVLVGGDEVSGTFHPSTYTSDPFQHQTLNLKDYARQEFTLCFEARNLISDEFDTLPNSEGDNVYIDNLWIYNDGNIGLTELKSDTPTWSIYPNPSQGEFILAIESKQTENNVYQVFNATGRLLKQQQIELEEGINEFNINLSYYPNGVYLIHIQGSAKQIVINK